MTADPEQKLMARQESDGVTHHEPPATSALTTGKARQGARPVAARYLQPKSAAVGGHSVPLTGRTSLAGFSSTGWVELQHPNHASTPLMVPSGSAGPGFCSTMRGKGGLALPTPVAGQRHSVQRPLEQQFVTPGPAANPRVSHSASSRGALGLATHSKQMLQTPRCLTMSAAISRAPATAARPGAHSADLTGTVTAQARAADADMKAKLSAWREQKQQQATRTAAKAGVFKEPAPKSMFRATAATRMNKDPATTKKAATSSAASRPQAGERSSSASGAVAPAAASRNTAASAVTSPAASSTADSAAGQASASSNASPSAFAATMATLQQSGGKPRAGASSSSKMGSNKPSPVPLLPLAQVGMGSSSPVTTGLQQQLQLQGAACSPMPGSSTKIPKLDLSSLQQQQQQSQTPLGQQSLVSSRGKQQTPLSSRRPSSSGGAEAVLPDATPRTARDALPSRVPRTPRTAAPATGRQQAPRCVVTPEGNDRVARQVDTLKSAAEQQHSSPFGAGAGKAAVPKLKLSALTKSPGPDALGALQHSRAPAGGHSCLSARGPSATARGSTAAALLPHGTPTAFNRLSSDGGGAGTPASTQQRGRTPRGPAPAAAGRPTPRSLSSSMSAAAGPAAAAAAAVPAKRAEADKADEVRQRLKLMRMQQLQLRHLNARMEAALHAKKEKMEASVAAAAAAVVDLSGQLLKTQDQSQQSAWQAQLQHVLQQQLGKLQAWGDLQAAHQAHVSQLQAACSKGLSHVPLLNGATVGHDPEQPDLQALQRQLQQGMQLLAELQPAMQLLVTGEASSSSTTSSSAVASSGSIRSSASEVHLHPKGIKDTAVLSRELMKVADEEVVLLQQLTQQLAELSDLQLYVNSMQVQLQLMNQPADVEFWTI